MEEQRVSPVGSHADGADHRRSVLRVPADPSSREQAFADLAVDSVVSNATLVRAFTQPALGEVGITEVVASLRRCVASVHADDLNGIEATLVAQASALNAIFAEMARRSGANMGVRMDLADRYMRLALKAQGQCRATLETLAAVKNPPVVFAKQANINNGGQQQVNNGVVASATAQAASHGENVETPQSELLEESNVQRLDTGASSEASRADTDLAPVGALNRAARRRGKGRLVA